MFINLLVVLYGMSQLFTDIHTNLPERIGEVVHVEMFAYADKKQRIVEAQVLTKSLWAQINAVYITLMDRRAITN